MAGAIRLRIAEMFGEGESPLAAAFTAPHFSCPSTRRTRAPRTWAPYSMLPSATGSMTLPATRMTKSRPSVSSNTNSGGTRESEQLRMIA